MLVLKPRTLLVVSLVVFGLACWYATSLDLAPFLSDDGGITLRYAERIALGKGFNYNDGESVNGASNPLYTLLLAAMLKIGLTPLDAIRAIAIPALGATTAMLFWTFARHWSFLAALVVVPAYWSTQFPLAYQLDALEPTLTVLFAAFLFFALHEKNRILQGVALGLLVANKLDGALAPIAFTVVWIAIERRFPWRQTFAALAAAAPAFLVLLVSFGSILPNSMLTKLGAETQSGFDFLWMVNQLRMNCPEVFFPALLSFLLPIGDATKLPRGVIQLWLVLVLGAYMAIDLGDPYPWYTVLPSFLLVILTGITVHVVFHGIVALTGSARPSGLRRFVPAMGVVLLVLYGWYEPWLAILDRQRDPARPDRINDAYAAEISRQAIGAWLHRYTDRTETLWSHFGLPAFEYKGPVFDGALLNSLADPTALDRAAYTIDGPFYPAQKPRDVLHDKQLVGLFRYAHRGGAYALYARSDSQIARAGLKHFRYVFEAVSYSDVGEYREPVLGQDYRLFAGTLHQGVPSKLAFVFDAPIDTYVSFTPAHPRLEAGADAGVAWSVFVDNELVVQGEQRPGDPAVAQRVRVVKPSPTWRHRIAFHVQPLDPANAPAHFSWANFTSNSDATFSSADFHAMCEPWAQRIDSVESVR